MITKSEKNDSIRKKIIRKTLEKDLNQFCHDNDCIDLKI